MSEEEEFEFRLRLESETASQPKQAKRDSRDDILADAPALSKAQKVRQQDKNVLGGLIRGAGSIGSTLVYPYDRIKGGSAEEGLRLNRERRAAIDSGLQQLIGSDPESAGYKTGKVMSEIGGTAGVGNVLAKGAQAVPYLSKAIPNLAPALRSGGFSVANKATTPAGMLGNAATRTAAGGLMGAGMAGLVNPEDAGTGAMYGAAMPGVAKVAGEAGMAINRGGKAVSRRLMQSALKPTIQQLKSGDARIAVDTLLDYGINPNKKGLEVMRSTVDDINSEIAAKLRGSTATVSRKGTLNYLGDVREKFGSQVNPVDDLSAVQKVADEFASHPYFNAGQAQGAMLEDALKKASAGKVQALQAAGKLKTFAAQQQNLAHGGGVNLSPGQPANQLYFNVGNTGGATRSPSAYPSSFSQRIAGRYTHNIDRVPEGEAGYREAMAAYAQRKADEQVARQAVENWQSSQGTIPVELAQKMKQGTYKALKGKYGEVGSASTEAQKALARGLKDQIAEVVPGIGQLNAAESRLLKTLDVAERRALMELNKNPLGLSALAGNKAAFAAFMADRSAAFKSLAARSVNRASEIPSYAPGLTNQLANPMLRGGLLSIQAD